MENVSQTILAFLRGRGTPEDEMDMLQGELDEQTASPVELIRRRVRDGLLTEVEYQGLLSCALSAPLRSRIDAANVDPEFVQRIPISYARRHRIIGLRVQDGCMPVVTTPLDVVEQVELERYTGVWYEIARYPAPFQQGCVGTTAEYTIRADGRIRVVNRCREGSLDGAEQTIEGVARVVDTQTNAKLKVSFFPPFEGDYWIIELDPDYQWAVVGEPARRYLWILSRTPTLDESIYQAILAGLEEKGYDPARLEETTQPAGD